MLRPASGIGAAVILVAACTSMPTPPADPLQVAFCAIEEAKLRLDGKVIRTVARYYANGHDVGLIDPGCQHFMIAPAPPRVRDEPYLVLGKALSELPPRSPPVKILEVDVSGLYHARDGSHGGVLELQKIWSTRPLSDL